MDPMFSVSTLIHASPEQAFWFLADPLTASIIDPAVVSYEPEGGTMGLGVTNHIRMRMLGVPLKLTSETIEWEPGRSMGFRSLKPARPAVAVARHLFEQGADGAVYTWSMEFLPTGFGGRIVAGAGAALLERNARAQQQRVRRVLEAANGVGRPQA